MATRIAAAKTVATSKIRKAVATSMKKTNNPFSNGIPTPTKKALDVFIPPSSTDVNGSYTGRPKHKDEHPVQDADDL